MSSDQGGLSRLRVVDVSCGIAGAYCTHLLSDAGADVIKLESPGGDPWRLRTVSDVEVDPVEGAALFRFLHHGTRSVVADPLDPAAVEAMLDDVDVLVESGAVPGLDHAGLRRRYPGLVIVSITPYGLTGPWADRAVSELVIQAESGMLLARGLPSDVPLMAGGRISDWVTGTFAAVAAAAAAREAQRSGHGEHVDVSALETMVICGNNYAEYRLQLTGPMPAGSILRTMETPSVEPTADGYVGFCTNSRQQFDDFLVLIERPDLLADDGLWRQPVRFGRWQEWNDIIHAWTRQYSTASIVEKASQLRIPVAPVLDADGVLGCEHFQARGIYSDDPTGTFKAPRRPWRMDDKDPPPMRPSPRLGEHTGRIERRPPSRRERPGGDRRLPLDGVQILDLTAWWAGPIAAGVLAALGAEVIHVESVSRLDGMRLSGGMTGAENQWWERSAHFLCANTNKRDLTLDLSQPDGLRYLRELVAQSDAVLENFSPRVLDNFGLGWETVSRLNPRTILLRMPAFGLSGPWRDNVGFAQTMEQVSGLAWLTGQPSDQPRIQRGPCDPNAGMHAAFALLVALAERDRTGVGSLLEIPMVEGALNAAAELVIERTAYGHALERDGNRSPGVAPQGVYRCRGDDSWMVLSIASDEQWDALVSVLGTPAWALAPALGSIAGRRASQDEIDAQLSSWCLNRDADELSQQLVDRGVPAGVARHPRQLIGHPQLSARQFHERVVHPVVGELPTPRVPFRFQSVERWLRRAAPTLGQDNRDILQSRLGLSDQQLEALTASGVIGDWPKGL